SRNDAQAMLRELKTFALLDGYRGAPKADIGALVDCIMAFADMATTLGTKLHEAEINPLRVFAQGQGVRAVDGLALLA
ncbi:acetate--CoA ligase family protein, partial [Pseudomonas sp. KHB2.9]